MTLILDFTTIKFPPESSLDTLRIPYWVTFYRIFLDFLLGVLQDFFGILEELVLEILYKFILEGNLSLELFLEIFEKFYPEFLQEFLVKILQGFK